MKKLQKNIYWIVCTIILAIIVLCGSHAPSNLLVRFCIFNNAGSEEISIYRADDSNCFVFLPSYAELDQVAAVVPSNQQISLGGVNLSNDMTCEDFLLETAYPLEINGRYVSTLWFYKSANIATMYIDTESGSMKRIHRDKDYEENASIDLYTIDGEINYSDELITIEGRGNSSWALPKKPYTITLGQSSKLLNMDSSEKWVLFSNGHDATNLHNKIVYEFADSVALQPAWAPDCTYVDVYLNGEYAGLYLLSPKINRGSALLNLQPDDYYFELMMSQQAVHSPTTFDICAVRAIDIIIPNECNDSQLAVLQNYINLFEEALFADEEIKNTNEPSWSDYIDMDSWARKYLIEEVFSNFDSGKASQYFWLDSSEQKIYSGPCWDYDLTFGKYWGTLWSTPCCMLAHRNWQEDTSWYNALCRKDEFMESVVEIYKTDFRPLLLNYIDEVIYNEAADIEHAVLSNQCRWSSIYSEIDWNSSVEAMVEYLRARVMFLDSIWLDNADFCTITIETTETYNICVPTGTICSDIPQPDAFSASGVWYVAETNTPFDMTLPITEDITLIPNNKDIPTRDYITVASVAMFVFLLLSFVYIDFHRRRQEKEV